MRMSKTIRDAAKQVFDKIDEMSDEEFAAELKKHENTELTKLLLYATEDHEKK